MAMIRVPFPDDPEERRSRFEKMAAVLVRFGTFEGTPEAGSFRGSSPVGHFAGVYRCPEGAGVLEIELTRKPLLVPTAMVERELRRFMDHHI